MFAGSRCPGRPFFLTADAGNAAPVLPSFANGDAVADRLAFGQDVIKKLVAGIDDNGAGCFLAGVVDDMPAVFLRNCYLPVGQVRHQLPVAPSPSSVCRGRKCPLHASAEHQADSDKDNCTHHRGPPRVDVAPLSGLVEVRIFIGYSVKVPSNPAIRAALRKKLGDVAKKTQGNLHPADTMPPQMGGLSGGWQRSVGRLTRSRRRLPRGGMTFGTERSKSA